MQPKNEPFFLLLCIKTKEEVIKKLMNHREQNSTCCNSIRNSGQDACFLSKTPKVGLEPNVQCQILFYDKKIDRLFSSEHVLRLVQHPEMQNTYAFMSQILHYILFHPVTISITQFLLF